MEILIPTGEFLNEHTPVHSDHSCLNEHTTILSDHTSWSSKKLQIFNLISQFFFCRDQKLIS